MNSGPATSFFRKSRPSPALPGVLLIDFVDGKHLFKPLFRGKIEDVTIMDPVLLRFSCLLTSAWTQIGTWEKCDPELVKGGYPVQLLLLVLWMGEGCYVDRWPDMFCNGLDPRISCQSLFFLCPLSKQYCRVGQASQVLSGPQNSATGICLLDEPAPKLSSTVQSALVHCLEVCGSYLIQAEVNWVQRKP